MSARDQQMVGRTAPRRQRPTSSVQVAHDHGVVRVPRDGLHALEVWGWRRSTERDQQSFSRENESRTSIQRTRLHNDTTRHTHVTDTRSDVIEHHGKRHGWERKRLETWHDHDQRRSSRNTRPRDSDANRALCCQSKLATTWYRSQTLHMGCSPPPKTGVPLVARVVKMRSAGTTRQRVRALRKKKERRFTCKNT